MQIAYGSALAEAALSSCASITSLSSERAFPQPDSLSGIQLGQTERMSEAALLSDLSDDLSLDRLDKRLSQTAKRC